MSGKKDAINDPNKPRLSLIPKEALWATGQALTYGENHYGTNNFKEGIPISYLLDGALRHINEFNDGEDFDEKSKNLHLGNAMANLAMAIYMYYNKQEYDDRFKKEKSLVDQQYPTISNTPLYSGVSLKDVQEQMSKNLMQYQEQQLKKPDEPFYNMKIDTSKLEQLGCGPVTACSDCGCGKKEMLAKKAKEPRHE